MIKVFIAEDEPFILKTIKRMIEDNHDRVMVVGEAFNGEMALEKIADLKPDVLFTDIRMPIMDGLTLISKLKEKGSDIIPVILSGYQDFEYAKKALQLGVLDYLLKPLDSEELTAILNDLCTRIHSIKINKQYRILKKVVDHCAVISDKEKEEFHSLLGSHNLYYMLCCAGSYCTFPCAFITPAKDFWFKYDLEDIVRQCISPDEEYWIIDSSFENEKLLFLGTIRGYENAKITFETIYNKLIYIGFPITSVVGSAELSVESMGLQIQKSQIALSKNIRFAKSQLIFEVDHEVANQYHDNDLSDINTEKHMNILIQYRQSNSFKKEFKKIMELCEEKSIRQIRLERLLKQVLNLFYNEMIFLHQGKIADTDFEINELISNSTTYQAIYEGICIIFDDLFNCQKNTLDSEDNNKKLLIDNIERYIKTNYSKQVTLQSLSEVFGFVPPYLSRIFKNSKGVSPNDYLISVRIEKAKELLLMEPPLILKEIAEAIGFNDQFYLSKVFKSVTGKSPSEFRLYDSKSDT